MKHSDVLSTSIAIMKYTGVWKPDTLIYPWNICYFLFALLIQGSLFYVIVISEITYVFLVLGDTDKTVDAAVLLLSHLVQGIKVLTIVLRQKRIKKLIDFIDGTNFSKSDPKKQAKIKKTVRLGIIVGQTMIISAGVTALFWCLVPTLQPEITLPLRTAYPFDISTPAMFYTMYVYNALSVVVVAVGDAAENYLVAGLIILAVVQLDVLCDELVEIGSNDEKSTYEDTAESVKYHQNIIEYVDELSSIFGLPILCQFIASSVIMCMTLFKITITTEPVELTTVCFYLFCVFLELLMYCYTGDLLFNKSLQVSEAAYPASWTGDVRKKKALLLTSLRSQRALVINAGGMFRTTLPTAASVVQTAYSYYAVLRQKADG